MLKRLGWVTELKSSLQFQFSNQSFFCIDISFTEEGENHINESIALVFQYLRLIKTEGVKQWIFEECRDLA
ncbi:insulinase family protein, partial [Escherichia coli]|nr:insulinase family protein [Escherichia coli]